MTGTAVTTLACGGVFLLALGSGQVLLAQAGVGTWVRSDKAGAGMTMTVEECCNGGRRLVYRLAGHSEILTTVDSALDGTDAPVLVAGKPSGETMALTAEDGHHVTGVLKLNGQAYGTWTATLSEDGRTLTVESEITVAAGARPVGKQTETWTLK